MPVVDSVVVEQALLLSNTATYCFGGERGLLTFTNISSSRQGYLLEMVDKLVVKTTAGLILRQEV